MKPSQFQKTKILLVFLAILVLIISIWFAKNYIKEIKSSLVQLAVIENHQSDGYYEEMVKKLAECESSNNPYAINPYDSKTSSLGLFQWKIETFIKYAKKYGVIGENASLNWIITLVFDRKTNEYLVLQILKNEDMETLRKLWGNCIKKIGFRKWGQN
jgi:hypothetical protein